MEVGDALRKLGWSVLDLADAGDGVPDYATSKELPNGRKFTALIEVKDGSKPPSHRKLTPAELKVKDSWQGVYIIALSGEDAITQLALAALGPS